VAGKRGELICESDRGMRVGEDGMGQLTVLSIFWKRFRKYLMEDKSFERETGRCKPLNGEK
jgi:hypothetical protein